MVKLYVTIFLKLVSLGVVIAAAGLWAGKGVDTRPKYRDEQTLIGGTIWSQLIIPIGLMISKVAKEDLDLFVHSYFLLSGVAICCVTGTVLLSGEYKAMKRYQNILQQQNNSAKKPPYLNYDKVYLGIGVLSLLAGALTFSEFLLLII